MWYSMSGRQSLFILIPKGSAFVIIFKPFTLRYKPILISRIYLQTGLISWFYWDDMQIQSPQPSFFIQSWDLYWQLSSFSIDRVTSRAVF